MTGGLAPFELALGEGADADLLPISALQHAVYCLRQAALIHLERLWEENRWTAEGQVLHARVDAGGARVRKGVKHVHGLSIGSRALGLIGKCDLVEVTRVHSASGTMGQTLFPVEFKRGRPKSHRADEVQLCAQALCLEEMTGTVVQEGALYYAQTRRRTPVRIDAELRELTQAVAADLRRIMRSGRTPEPTPHVGRCRRCSLRDLCQPDAVRKPSARQWLERRLRGLLTDEDAA